MNEKTVEKKSAVRNSIVRIGMGAVAILLQLVWMMEFIFKVNQYSTFMSGATTVLALLLVLTIYGQHKTSAMKMPWIMLILVVPFFGVALYLLVGLSGTTKKMRKRYEEIDRKLYPKLKQDLGTVQEIREKDLGMANISHYIEKTACYPMYGNSDVEFYEDASKGLEAQKEELRKAEKFIFMEYHAIEDGESWHELQDILVEKAAAGVEVRIFYDDMGSIGFINVDFIKRMEALGIQCRVFNPVMPFLNLFLNNRDHRKITVIDGKVGFTGGYNLANEYFNRTHPYGKWKDTGVKITGEAVRSLTVMFLEMWNAIRESDKDDTDYEQYLSEIQYIAKEKCYIQPYADSPMDEEQVGENVYMNIIESAQSYVYFITPYLIITDEMNHALGLAAKRGVDVRIMTPGIPDKKMIYQVTRSYYAGLARNGVRIFEYTPGFCHAKQCVSDDKVAVCGTINLDYRSLYHHFENGCLMYDCKAVHDMKQDFDRTFMECREVTEEYTTGRSSVMRVGQCVLRLFAALL